jgi:hypothetical protein
MSWPKNRLVFEFEAGIGWRIGANSWIGTGEYHDGISTDEVMAILRNPRTECRSASVWVFGRQISDYVEPARALAILQSFPRAAEADFTRARSVIGAWRPN